MSLTPTGSKWAECLKCGWVGRISVYFPIKVSMCADCGALTPHLRILRNEHGQPINGNRRVINIRTGEEKP